MLLLVRLPVLLNYHQNFRKRLIEVFFFFRLYMYIMYTMDRGAERVRLSTKAHVIQLIPSIDLPSTPDDDVQVYIIHQCKIKIFLLWSVNNIQNALKITIQIIYLCPGKMYKTNHDNN